MSNFDFLKNFLGKSAKLGKDVHDMSNREAYSLGFGTIAPISYVKCVPNEHYKGNFSGYVQTAPMREDNFAEIFNNLKAVYVPMSSICRNYLQMTQGNRWTRSDMVLDFPVYDLRMNISLLLNNIFPQFLMQQLAQGLVSVLAQYENVNIYYDSNAVDSNNHVVIEGRISSDQDYHDLRVDFPRGSNVYLDFIYDGPFSLEGEMKTQHVPLKTYFGLLYNCCTLSGNLFYLDALRLLDNLGYGNYMPSFVALAKKYFTFGSRLGNLKFVCGLDGVDVSFSEIISRSYFSAALNETLLPFIAYQYYINVAERSNYRKPNVALVTLDAICQNYAYNNGLSLDFVNDHLEFNSSHFANFSSCLAFGELVSLYETFLNGEADFQTLSDQSKVDVMFLYFFSLSNPLIEPDLYTSSQLSIVEGSIPTTAGHDINANLVQTIADVSALYKLRQDLLRAGVRRDKQMQALFGVSGNQHVYEKIQILDANSSPVKIQGLINMAETSEAPLGARAARGNGQNGLSFKLDTEDFGFIFIVQSFTCRAYYESFMIDQSWQIGPSSWFLPQFNNLGLEPVRNIDCSLYRESYSNGSTPSFTHLTDTLGFTSHYWRLKQRLDKVHGLFTNFGLPIWSETNSVIDSGYLQAKQGAALVRGNAAFGGFLPTFIEQQADRYAHQRSLYYSPDMVNNIFAQMVDGAIYSDMSFDQFRCVFSFELKKFSPMPKLGLLKLNV